MGSSDSEPAKQLLPYLQRADELQRHEPLVAYYCRLYAMDCGLKIPQKERTKMTNSILLSLMNQLEKDKKTVKLGPEDNLYLEGFASNVFAKADKQDRAGRADLNTAKTFYAASIFFDILNQFGALQPDIEQKQKYAVWKAAEIRKAIKEGRQPEPGPPGREQDNKQTDPYGIGPGQNSLYKQQTDQVTFSQDGGSRASLPTVPSLDRSRSANFPAAPPADHSRTTPTTTTHLDPPSQRETERFATAPPPPPYTSPPAIPGNTNSYYDASKTQPSESPGVSSYPHTYSDGHNIPPPGGSPEASAYPHSYPQPPYRVEPQHPESYYAPEDAINPSSFPHFQSYPSFQESTLPAVPSRNPSFFYSPDTSASAQALAAAASYAAPPPPMAVAAPPADQYSYDSSYEPAVEKIAEAHKAARFAVGALAFDDVVTAVDHLKRALDLLTNPSADVNRQ